jgi:hypothetical protein
MAQLKVINLKSTLPSFSWQDGLYAVQKEVDGILHLWKIKDGKLDNYENAKPNILCTSVRNEGLHETDLFIMS